MSSIVAPDAYKVEAAWTGQLTGVFTIGTSAIGGPDVIGGTFGNNVFDDLTAVTMSVTFQRGRPDDLQTTAQGMSTFTLTDPNHTYDPLNPASPLAGLLVPMRPIRARATYSGTTYGRFYGFISRIEHDPDLSSRQTVIEAVDFFEWLAQAKPVIAPQVGKTVGQIIGVILDAVGWTDPTLRNLMNGDTIPSWTAAQGVTTGLQLIQDLLTTDLGMFFIDGAGIPTYVDRSTRYAAGTPAGSVLAGVAGKGIKHTTDKQAIINVQTVTRLFSQQTISVTGTPTGGTFTLTLDSQTTAAIAYNATAAAVQTALAALSNIGVGNVTCTGGALPGTVIVAALIGSRNPMTAVSSLTGGTTPAVSVSASQVSGTPQTATDAASLHQYANRAATAISSANFDTDTKANSMAQFVVTVNAQPRPPARQFSVVNQDAATLLRQLSLELSDPVPASDGGAQFNGRIQAISETWDAPGRVINTSYIIQQENIHVFTIGTSAIGGPDVFGY